MANFTASELDVLHAVVADVSKLKQEALERASHKFDTDESINVTFTLYATSLVMLMQLGFSLVESGSVRNSSYRHVFLKNMLDFVLGLAFWWAIGYWIAFPDKVTGNLFGNDKYEIFNSCEETRGFAFQSMFATTACTIVSGAMAERTRMEAYLVFVILMTSLAYSVVVQWTWGGGWMNDLEPAFHDFAGSGVIHEVGGIAAFVGAYLVGPRIGRFYQDPGVLRVPKPFAARSVDGIVMGTFLLWFGWFGFNPGSAGNIAGEGASATASKAFVNTMIAPAFAALTVISWDGSIHTLQYIRFGKKSYTETHPKFDIGMVANGVLSGLVAITAGCDAYSSTYSALAGVISAFVLLITQDCLSRMQIDDPVGAVAVHGINGIWGIISVGLFHESTGLVTTGQSSQLVSQCIGAASIAAYIASTTSVYFYIVSCYGFLRVPKVVEVHGIDFEEFGDGEAVDTTALNLELESEYSASLISTLSGDFEEREGLEVEKCREYAHIHKRVNVATLTFAIIYNFLYYPYFQWRGWIFWAFVNTAVGLQSAAGAHAQFRVVTSDHKATKHCCCTIVFVGVALAITNFLISPTENLVASYLETMSMAAFWAIWMQLRLQPLEWRTVSSFHESERSAVSVYLKCLTELASQDNPMLRCLKMNSRAQHALEIAVVYASLIADLWAALGTLEENRGTGIILMVLIVVQIPGTLGKILEPTNMRSQKLIMLLCINTWVSKGPILALLFVAEEMTAIILISIAFNVLSLAFQVVNVFVAAKYAKQRAARMNSPRRGSSLNNASSAWTAGSVVRTSDKKQDSSSLKKRRHPQEQDENTTNITQERELESGTQERDSKPPRTKDVPMPTFTKVGHDAMKVRRQKSGTSLSDNSCSVTLSDVESNVATSTEGKRTKASTKGSSGFTADTGSDSPLDSYTPKTPTLSIDMKGSTTPSSQDIHGHGATLSVATSQYEEKVTTPRELSLDIDGKAFAPLPPPDSASPKLKNGSAKSPWKQNGTNGSAPSPYLATTNGASGAPGSYDQLYAQYHQSYQQNLLAWVHRQQMVQQQQQLLVNAQREQRKQRKYEMQQQRQLQQQNQKQQQEKRQSPQTEPSSGPPTFQSPGNFQSLLDSEKQHSNTMTKMTVQLEQHLKRTRSKDSKEQLTTASENEDPEACLLSTFNGQASPIANGMANGHYKPDPALVIRSNSLSL